MIASISSIREPALTMRLASTAITVLLCLRLHSREILYLRDQIRIFLDLLQSRFLLVVLVLF